MLITTGNIQHVVSVSATVVRFRNIKRNIKENTQRKKYKVALYLCKYLININGDVNDL